MFTTVSYLDTEQVLIERICVKVKTSFFCHNAVMTERQAGIEPKNAEHKCRTELTLLLDSETKLTEKLNKTKLE